MLFDYSIIFSQAALKAAQQTKDGKDDEIATLHVEIQVIFQLSVFFSVESLIYTSSSQVFSSLGYNSPRCLYQNLKDDAAAAVEQQQEAESEAKALRTMTQRMILTQEEMVCIFPLK